MTLQVGVKTLIRNGSGKYLLLQRSKILDSEAEPLWDIPGGRIDSGEPLLEALQRELSEEIGADSLPAPRLVAAQDIFVESKDLHVVRLTYRVDGNYQAIKLSDEHSAYRWVTAGEIKDMVIDPYLQEVLDNLTA
jgi:8-oxo-dGTP diphosphatase